MDARLLNSPTGTQAAVVLALLLSIFSAGCTASTAVHPGESTSIVSAQAAEKTAPTSSGGPQEGIKVHGHWTIEVRDPDGTLVIRREFENALATDRTRGFGWCSRSPNLSWPVAYRLVWLPF